ncbi:MAG: SxtJ family membrane protein, partial [Bacteroidota bacterium]
LLCLPLLLYPLARWIHLGWMALAKGLGWINTRLLLGIIFFVLLWPLAALRRVFRSELISKSADPKADTYYKEKEKKSPEAEDFLTPW